MRQIDALYLNRPFYGSRRVSDEFQQHGPRVNRNRVQRVMGCNRWASAPYARRLEPVNQGWAHDLSLPPKGLTRGLPNQVWVSAICYLPMAKKFMNLTVILGWFSRLVLAWRVANTLEAVPCIPALEEALARDRAPEIFNADQGAQYTSEACTAGLLAHAVKSSMAGNGR